MSRKKKINTKYSPEFKLSVIMDMRENHLSYRETARKYNIGSNESQGKDRLYWNNKRISRRLKGMSPVQYRTHCQTI